MQTVLGQLQCRRSRVVSAAVCRCTDYRIRGWGWGRLLQCQACFQQKHSLFSEHVSFCSVGAHVRDAAAYVCWAFARAYTAVDLADSITVLAPALLVTACYDREVCPK